MTDGEPNMAIYVCPSCDAEGRIEERSIEYEYDNNGSRTRNRIEVVKYPMCVVCSGTGLISEKVMNRLQAERNKEILEQEENA